MISLIDIKYALNHVGFPSNHQTGWKEIGVREKLLLATTRKTGQKETGSWKYCL